MVPTKHKGFCARLGLCGKVRSLQGLSEIGINKKHFFEIISLESQHFSEKEGKDVSSQISLEFTCAYRKANTVIKILKLHG